MPYNLKQLEYIFIGAESAKSNLKLATIDGMSVDDLAADAGSGSANDTYKFDESLLRGAMMAIPADDYDIWINVGIALKSAAIAENAELTDDEAYEFWLEWSALSPKFDENACMKKWEGMNPTGEKSLGSVFYAARENGWAGNRRLTWSTFNEENEDGTIEESDNAVQNKSRKETAEPAMGGAGRQNLLSDDRWPKGISISGESSGSAERGISVDGGDDCASIAGEKEVLRKDAGRQVLQEAKQPIKAKRKIDKDIERLNARHFVTQEGGKTRIITEKYDRILGRSYLTSSSFEDFRNFYCNQLVPVEVVTKTKKGRVVDVELKPLGDFWIRSQDRRQYEEIVFAPGQDVNCEDNGIDGCYNLWRGWAVQPDENGDWSLLQQHILENICSGDRDHFKYYMDWMAAAVQKPDCAGNVAVVLRGNRGVGKGTAVGYFGQLFGQHYIHVTNSRQVTGNFNSHLRDAVLLFSDEAVYAGNKSEEATLKGLITEQYLTIEAKGKDIVTVKNNLHVIMATNNDWAVPAGTDERRFFVLNVGDKQKQNVEYFTAIKKQMEAGGLGRMLHDLLSRDINGFRVFDVPKTEALLEQKIETFDNITAWWYDKLQNGYIFDGIDWDKEIPAEAVYQDYIEYSNNIGHRHKYISSKFGKFLCKANGEGWPKLSRKKAESSFREDYSVVKDSRVKHYRMADLDNCRKIFEKMIGQAVAWAGTAPAVGNGNIEDEPM